MTAKKDFYADGQSKPPVLRPQFVTIPAALRDAPRWVVWRLEAKENSDGSTRQAKVPYQTSGTAAKANYPGTWTAFEAAKAAYERGRYDGVGLMLGDGFAGVDLDNAIDPATVQLYPWAADIVARFATYTEVSPSGTGVKLYCRGKWTGRRKRWPVPGTKGGDIEVYDDARYFTVTGQVVGTVTEVADAQAALDELAACPGAKGNVPAGTPTDRKDEAAPAVGDDELLAKAEAAKNGDKFKRLMAGDQEGYSSQSEADLALCSLLALWCRKDDARMGRLFRRSKLMRDKWDTPRGDSTYGAHTIARAIDGCDKVYTGGANGPDPPAGHGSNCPAEAPDDPHRLARGFRDSLSPNGGPPRLRHWQGDFWAWEHGKYSRMGEDDVRARLLAWVRDEFDRLWRAEHGGWVAAGRKKAAPLMRKVTTGLTANVLAALKARSRPGAPPTVFHPGPTPAMTADHNKETAMPQTTNEDTAVDNTTAEPTVARPAAGETGEMTTNTTATSETIMNVPATTTPPAAAVKTLTVGNRIFKVPFADLLPPQTADERQRLRDDIQLNGIKVPVAVTHADEVLDGHHRLAIAAELGLALADIPLKVETGLTAEQKRQLATTLNTHRRQLTQDQVRETITNLLKADPELSDRQIAERAKVDHKTVGRQRRRLTASGAVPQTTVSKGRDGRTQKRSPAKPKATQPPPAAPKATTPDWPETSGPADTSRIVPRGIGTRPWSRALEEVDHLLDQVRGDVRKAMRWKVSERRGGELAPVSQQLRELADKIDSLRQAHEARNATTP